jgi:hypothetical protein
MNELIRAMKKALRHELVLVQEFIANELARMDGEIRPPPNYGNGEITRRVPRFDTAEIGSEQ